MFNKITPESAGVSSACIKEYLDYLNRRGIAMHGVLFMKGEDIFAECYWTPFDKDFCHRMYSQTKSYVAIAIGLLQDEGKLKITDKIMDYFPEKIHTDLHEYLKEQTIEDMLLMCTAGETPYWFNVPDEDRTELYLNKHSNARPSRTVWQYDSAGSQVMCNLVEKLSGKTMLEYMKEKLFDEMGTFKTAQLLKVRNGDSWGDSALVCTQRDMASFARLLLNGGSWHGKRLVSEDYVKRATSPLVSCSESGFYDCFHAHGTELILNFHLGKLRETLAQSRSGERSFDAHVRKNRDRRTGFPNRLPGGSRLRSAHFQRLKQVNQCLGRTVRSDRENIGDVTHL